ncbi:MAG: ArsA family ATPase [Bacteroidota bacterium]
MRIILFTGKGGVGKTTISAATAIQAANKGIKTLVLSTDPAHSLADALDQELGTEPIQISPNLFAQEIDVYYSMKKHWENIRELMLTVFKWQGIEQVVAEELSALPGMEEASAFLWLEEYYRQKAYDLIIIDSAPTGETLGLLTLPQVTQTWIMKAFPFQKLAMKGFGGMVRGMTGIPLDKGLEELEVLFDKLNSIQKVMLDPSICSIRVVVNPEKMVIKEAQRAFTYLQLYGYNVDGIVVNRIFPANTIMGGFEKYYEKQASYLKQIEEDFSPLPLFKVLHKGEEVFGKVLLEEIGMNIYGDEAPNQIYYQGQSIEIKEEKNGYEVSMNLAFTSEKELEVHKFGDELVIQLNNQRKSMYLPRFTNYLKLDHFTFDKPKLTIRLSR